MSTRIAIPQEKNLETTFDTMLKSFNAEIDTNTPEEVTQKKFIEEISSLPYSMKKVKNIRESKKPHWSHKNFNHELGKRYINCMDLMSLIWSSDDPHAFVTRNSEKSTTEYVYMDWLQLIQEFMEEHYNMVDLDKGRIPALEIQTTFYAYCKKKNNDWSAEITPKVLGVYLKKLGYLKKRISSGIVYCGLAQFG